MRRLHSARVALNRTLVLSTKWFEWLKEFESIVFRHFILLLLFTFTHLKMAFGIFIGTQTFSLFFARIVLFGSIAAKPEHAACAREHQIQTYKRTIIVLFIKHLVCSIWYRLIFRRKYTALCYSLPIDCRCCCFCVCAKAILFIYSLNRKFESQWEKNRLAIERKIEWVRELRFQA